MYVIRQSSVSYVNGKLLHLNVRMRTKVLIKKITQKGIHNVVINR